jgi:hypothetical protein
MKLLGGSDTSEDATASHTHFEIQGKKQILRVNSPSE